MLRAEDVDVLMSYLSRRMREINAEECRRALPKYAEDIQFLQARTRDSLNLLLHGPMADSYRDERFAAIYEEALQIYEETLRARNPMGYVSPIDFRGRGA